MAGELNPASVKRLHSPLATTVEVYEEVDSTQARARELARSGAPSGTLVVSGVQTGGRGRLGRRWGSPPGGLWMSLVLRPKVEASLASRVTQAAAVGVAKALWALGVEVLIKWPNDLLVEPGERKITGILAESSVESVPVASKGAGASPGGPERPRVDFIVLGVGVNANLDPADLGVTDREVATLRSELGRDVDLLRLLGSLLSHLETELDRLEDFEAILDDWRALSHTLGRKVRVQRFGKTLEGRAIDLSSEGALLVETAAGETVELYEGEVEHLRGG